MSPESSIESAVRAALVDFVDDLQSEVDAHRLEALLRGDDTLAETDVGSKPEAWTRKHLIRPLLDAVGLEWEPEIHGKGEGYPDFGIVNVGVPVIGEDKSINRLEAAEADVKEYLNNRAASRDADYGVATDGIRWVVYRIELSGDYLDYEGIEPTPIDFRPALLEIASERGDISVGPDGDRSVETDGDAETAIATFAETFERESFDRLLTREAPRRIRERKRAGIEEFYDLYVELLFGEGSRSYDYETTLLDGIDAPDGTAEPAKRRFAIQLVNRLLFVKFLEDREVLPERFLSERVEDYLDADADTDGLAGGLYATQLEPVFFNLFNTERDDRLPIHRGGWHDEVPYLNGSLFSPGDDERLFDVDDGMLVRVVRDLVEGHELEGADDGRLDPSVLGNVFEMTINHLSSGQAQKDEGAYYTPSDVIQLITRQAVDPKIYEVLVDVYADRLADSDELSEAAARDLVSDYDLGEMLREIEQREGYFRDSAAIREAYERLGELTVVDPACGSGHFLTGVLDGIHRVRMSLLRGLKGDDLAPADVYRAKKELVLDGIYGVDVNPIAVEIAKLRVWLKMVEEGWQRGFGELPNVDVNIVAGNSLVGLPANSSGQSVLSAFDVDLSAIRDVRKKYKEGKIDRAELEDRIDDLRPELRQQYLDQLNHTVEERIASADRWATVTAGLDDLYPTVQKITARNTDGDQLSAAQQRRLEEAGFGVESRFEKSAKVEGEAVEDASPLGDLLGEEFVFEVQRQPVRADLRELEELGDSDEVDLSHEPFHWPVEFPEAVSSNGNGHDVEFDVVVGNPPYGDVMEDVEQRMTAGYATATVNDVIAPFVERELQLLDDEGYFGNILALLIAYQSNASSIRELFATKLHAPRMACFARRPTQVFQGSQARTGIVTGERSTDGETGSIQTSRFVRFREDEREDVFQDVDYEPTDGLILGEKIGVGGNESLPKVGTPEIRSILEKLKDHSDTVFRDVMSRDEADETDHVVWRSYHPAYFLNPFLEDLYPPGERSRDFEPMYFESDLDRKAAFLLMQSSLFYLYWMVYENERDLNWKSVEAFPFPDREALESNREGIDELADATWDEMEARFLGNVRETFDTIGAIKPLTDAADDLFGPMFDLTPEEIEYVKRYDESYRLGDVDEGELVDFEWSTDAE